MQVHQPSPGSVEEIVSQIATLASQGQSFQLFIPEALTLGGHAVPEPMAKVIIVEKALSLGYRPEDPTPRDGGRVFTFRLRL